MNTQQKAGLAVLGIAGLIALIVGVTRKGKITLATLTAISITPTSASMAVGASQQFVAMGHYSDGSISQISSYSMWSSSNTSVATVTSAGLATGVAAGTTAITATLAGITSAPVNLTVTQVTPPPIGGAVNITLSLTNLPIEAACWGCAFFDPINGMYYQPTNTPAAGGHLFSPDESIQISAPVSSGTLSIIASGAYNGGLNLPLVGQWQPHIDAVNNGKYVFDCSTETIRQI